jgi:PhnB protein
MTRHPDGRKDPPMASRLNPYLNFDGNAREAMEFYRDVFGGTLDINTFSEFGMTDPPVADHIMHAQLETPSGFTLMASDLPPEMELNAGNNVNVCLNGEDADELRGYWKQLSDGANVVMPLEAQMWGDEFGSCIDRFGTHWMVNISQPQA